MVHGIYEGIRDTELVMAEKYGIKAVLPEEIFFITLDEQIKKHPTSTGSPLGLAYLSI
jgi:asparagine synthetase A